MVSILLMSFFLTIAVSEDFLDKFWINSKILIDLNIIIN